MQYKNFLQRKGQNIQFYNQKNTQEYIFFRLSVPQSILALIKQQNKQLRQKYFKELYNQISLSIQNNEKYCCQSQQELIQTIKNISVFGGVIFSGKKAQCDINENPICLKLNHIENINFINLKIIFFDNCSVTSIESLFWLDIKKIKTLCLSGNNITSLKPFRQTSFVELTVLNLSRNVFASNQLKNIHSSHSPELKQIQIYRGEKINNICLQDLDLRKLLKIQIDQNRWDEGEQLVVYCDEQIYEFRQNKLNIEMNQHSIIFLNQN